MQYMLMCCFDETAWNNLPDAEKDRLCGTMGIGYRTLSTRAASAAGATPPGGVGDDCARDERQDSSYRWTFRRDKEATRRLPPYRLHGSERGDVDRGPDPDASRGRLG